VGLLERSKLSEQERVLMTLLSNFHGVEEEEHKMIKFEIDTGDEASKRQVARRIASKEVAEQLEKM